MGLFLIFCFFEFKEYIIFNLLIYVGLNKVYFRKYKEKVIDFGSLRKENLMFLEVI